MPSYDYDLFTIGAGSGGVRASRVSASFGAKVGIAENRFLGGTCVNVGCVPKKLMVYASHYREIFHEAEGFGWRVEGARFDWPTFIEHKNTEISRLNGVYRRLLVNAGVQLFEGRAKIIGPHTIEVTDPQGDISRHTAEHILVATGGQPQLPSIPGGEHAFVSDDILSLPQQPKRVVVVGGGYIAVEFAGIFRGLGSEVSLLYRGPQLLRGFDDEVRDFVTNEIRKKGISVHLDHSVSSIVKEPGGLRCQLHDGSSVEGDAVLYAIGRTPNVSGLGLESVEVKLNKRGAIQVDNDYQTTAPKIYAIGDVIDRINLTPVALAQGMVVARNLFGKQPSELDYADVATAVFSQPPLATVGLTEAQAKERLHEIDVYASEFTPLLHTLSKSSERTFMKLIVEKKSQRVVGVHMVGADAPEIIQMAAIALKCNATKAQFDATIGIHPTASEEFVTMRTPRPSK